MKTKPVYILGTGLSHDGSSCIIKDGEIAVAIEKERITRTKHDGGNDRHTMQYCLDALGLKLQDISLIVQVANFEKESIKPDYHLGARLYHPDVPVVTISHHLAHAYSAIATSPFTESNVLVIDGAGSPAAQCDDWPDESIADYWCSQTGLYCEKDSFYFYDGEKLNCLYKDFSELRLFDQAGSAMKMPTNYHSIGGLYAAASNYCFRNMDDAGKLMGLAPYGRNTYTGNSIFHLENGMVAIQHNALDILQTPSQDYEHFKTDFQHYADVAKWIQYETEKAVAYLVNARMQLHPHANLSYAGGVALNAVCNARMLKNNLVENLYMQPAAGDNGLAIGCAYYGWHQVYKREIPHTQNKSVFFGRSYGENEIETTLRNHKDQNGFVWEKNENYIDEVATLLADGKVIGWYQGGAEFGPRALGHRSILADPRGKDVQSHINSNIKFREDFRPFAPAVLKEEVATYFKHGWESPYMILIDEIKDEWKDIVPGIVHVDGTCRVQTVGESWTPEFYKLLQSFKKKTGIAVLVNTSFNKKGMPIVETPLEALDFFLTCALDILVMDTYIIKKTTV